MKKIILINFLLVLSFILFAEIFSRILNLADFTGINKDLLTKNDDYFINSSSSLNNNEDNQNYSYFSQLPMDESDKYMSSQSEKLNSSEIKKYIPLIAVTSIFTLILFTIIKRA